MTFGQLMDITQSGRASSHYTGLPLDDSFCTKTMRIYPSQTMENEYRTSDPQFTAFIAACIFLFSTLVFIIYDLIVARRQKIVLGRALAAGAIVNSLFPEQVRNQLYQEKKAEQEQNKNAKEFLNPAMSNNDDFSGRPIASLHENTTIFFADLAGFTKWSSTRSPVEVFELLETLYRSFDVIAKRRGVFKVRCNKHIQHFLFVLSGILSKSVFYLMPLLHVTTCRLKPSEIVTWQRRAYQMRKRIMLFVWSSSRETVAWPCHKS